MFGSESSGEASTPKRPKVEQDFRISRMQQIQEEVKTINTRISFKLEHRKRISSSVTTLLRKLLICRDSDKLYKWSCGFLKRRNESLRGTTRKYLQRGDVLLFHQIVKHPLIHCYHQAVLHPLRSAPYLLLVVEANLPRHVHRLARL